MSDIITGAAIPDDVMAEAARAICDQNDAWWEDAGPLDREVYVDYVRVALPILTLAIQRELIERMIVNYRQGYDSEWGDITEWLQSFLTTEDEEEK